LFTKIGTYQIYHNILKYASLITYEEQVNLPAEATLKRLLSPRLIFATNPLAIEDRLTQFNKTI
jgi:hypothetical protein